MRKKITRTFSALLVIVLILLSHPVFAQDAAVETGTDYDLNYIKSVMDMIKARYKGDVTDRQLIEGALKGMFDSLDPYTSFFNPTEAKDFLNDMQGTYDGIGIMISKVGDYVVIVKVFSASPAEKAGIMTGQKIAAINGKNMVGASLEEVSSLIRGTSGSKVTIGIIKNGETGVADYVVVRDKIKVNPVSYEIKDNIGYIKMDIFNSNIAIGVDKALNEMDSKKITRLILDLRNNPGGDVSQVVAVASHFVPEGLITKLDFKSEDEKDIEYYSNLKKIKYKVAVLVNGQSASGSEILAGAIQDTKAGVLIGTKTYGKAKVQNLIPMLSPAAYEKYEKQLGVKLVDVYDLIDKYGIAPAESEIIGYTKMSMGIYTTPKGRMIDGTGLTPDIIVKDYELVKDIDVNSIQKLSAQGDLTLNGESMDIYNTEKILKILGYDIDMPDMKLDGKTAKAIAGFRKESGLPEGDVLDIATQKALNSKLGKLLVQIDKQYAKAVEVLMKQ